MRTSSDNTMELKQESQDLKQEPSPSAKTTNIESRSSQTAVEDETIQSLRLYLVNVLHNHTLGDSNNYNNLLYELHHLFIHSKSSESISQRQKLFALLSAFSGCVSSIQSQHHSSLIEEFMNAQFCDYTPAIADLLLSVYCSLMLINPMTVWGCLCSMAISMVPFKTICPRQNPYDQWTPPPQLLDIQNTVLSAVEKVASLKPNLCENFVSALMTKQPYSMRPCESHCMYLTALFSIMKRKFGLGLKRRLWEMIIQHLVEMDSSVLANDLVRESEDGVENSVMFECEMEQESCYVNGRISDNSQQKMEVSVILGSLDAMMELIFLELEQLLQEEDQFLQIWETIKSAFCSFMVTKNEAQFSHFLIFYLLQRKPQILYEDFLPLCLEKIEDAWISPSLRGSYASYIVSLLARAKFVSVEIKLSCLESLLKTAERYARDHPERKTSSHKQMKAKPFDQPDVSNTVDKHDVFYACMQGVMYLSCYLLPLVFKDKQEMKEKVKVLVQKRVSALLYHWSQPLNHTAAAVAVHFVNLTSQLEILDCKNLIHLVDLNDANGRLKPFFPFDPYCLNRSSRFLNLKETYMTWKEVSMSLPQQRDSLVPLGDQDVDDAMSDGSLEEDDSLLATTPQSRLEFGVSMESVGASSLLDF